MNRPAVLSGAKSDSQLPTTEDTENTQLENNARPADLEALGRVVPCRR
jgi:hypothetical protein